MAIRVKLADLQVNQSALVKIDCFDVKAADMSDTEAKPIIVLQTITDHEGVTFFKAKVPDQRGAYVIDLKKYGDLTVARLDGVELTLAVLAYRINRGLYNSLLITKLLSM